MEDTKMHFVVTIRIPKILEPQVVRNYVTMAMKKYDKAIMLHNQSGYFDGVRGQVGFAISEVPALDHETDIRGMIAQIKKVHEHMETIDGKY